MTSIGTSIPLYSYAPLLNPASAETLPVTPVLPASLPNQQQNSGVSGADSGLPNLSSDIISLLQQLQPTQVNDTSALFGNANSAYRATDALDALIRGGNGGSSGLTEALVQQSSNQLLSNVYASAVEAAYNGTAQQAVSQNLAQRPVQDVLTRYQDALNAYSAAQRNTIMENV